MVLRKAFYYLCNMFRFSFLKVVKRYKGSVLQVIPLSTEVKVEKGASLCLEGRLSCRNNCYISSSGMLSIKKGCFINCNVQIVSLEKIQIGEDVIVGPNVVIVDHDHDYKSTDRKHLFNSSPIIIGDNVWIGANSVIMKGTIIGNNSVIAAGTTIKGKYPDNSLIYQEKETRVREIEEGKDV